jgi:hypothetical protein
MPGDSAIEFESRDLGEVVALWQSTAGSRPPSVLRVENGAGVIAMFPPVGSWEAGPPRDFDLIFPVRVAVRALLDLPAPWRALALSDFLCHVFDASHSASPEETIRVTVRCIEALGGGLPARLRATTRGLGETRA